MNTNLIIQNAIRKLQKDGGGYVIIDSSAEDLATFTYIYRTKDLVPKDGGGSQPIHKGINVLFFKNAESIYYRGSTSNILNITFINFMSVQWNNPFYTSNMEFINCNSISGDMSQCSGNVKCNTSAFIDYIKRAGNIRLNDLWLQYFTNRIISNPSILYLDNTSFSELWITPLSETFIRCTNSSRLQTKFIFHCKNLNEILLLRVDNNDISNFLMVIDDSTKDKYIWKNNKWVNISKKTIIKLTLTANTNFSYSYKDSNDVLHNNTLKLTPENSNLILDTPEIEKFTLSVPTAVTEITIDGKINDCTELFSGYTNLTKLDISKLDMSDATAITNMFNGCSKLTTLIGIDNLNPRNVPVLNDWFSPLTSWTGSVNCSTWNTHKVTNIASLFNSTKLTDINLSNWDMSSCPSAVKVFYNCNNLKSVNLSNWKLPVNFDISAMFQSCTTLQSIVLKGWDISKLSSVAGIFKYCSKLIRISMPFNGTDNKLTTEYANLGLNKSNLTIHDTDHNVDYKWISNAWKTV